jgi:argininosuccinate lyase
MPQKRNPVALEHARALLSKALGQATALPVALHNTPFGDIVDTEDDVQPLVVSMFRDATRAVALVAVAMTCAELAVDRMAERAATGWVTVTELADTLTRDHGVPFGTAHAIVARMIREGESRPGEPISDALATASRAVLGREIRIDEPKLAALLGTAHFVAVRQTAGGPAPGTAAAALADSAANLTRDREALTGLRKGLARAAERLREAAEA